MGETLKISELLRLQVKLGTSVAESKNKNSFHSNITDKLFKLFVGGGGKGELKKKSESSEI